MTHDLVPQPVLTLEGRPIHIIGPARVYACGITPYDVTHLGHAATFVWVDAAVRVLRHAGLDTVLVRNVTDVDDVLTEAARRSNTPYDVFAAMHQYQFDHDLALLSVRRPEREPRAHVFIPPVIALAQILVDRGAAYVVDGSVYFRGGHVPGRAGVAEDAARALLTQFGEDPEDPAKESPFDVPVWRASSTDQPSWPSPWGPGRPGWHAECTAMVLSELGPGVDLHAGGAELAFPHHAYEAAQAEAATGVAPFARAWLRVGTVQTAGEKMAKSTGNLVLVAEVLADHSPAALRLALLNRSWSAPWDYDESVVTSAAATLEALYSAAGRPGSSPTAEADVVAALRTGLDVPRAVEVAVDSGGSAARTLVQVLALQ
ncbi:MAG TPA: cysteine--tRNA ligase [Actinomycetes bacterium]|nr:cysteine--tRNA ligase [Actinomycetes bacterium]